jgi:hypothetical protein
MKSFNQGLLPHHTAKGLRQNVVHHLCAIPSKTRCCRRDLDRPPDRPPPALRRVLVELSSILARRYRDTAVTAIAKDIDYNGIMATTLRHAGPRLVTLDEPGSSMSSTTSSIPNPTDAAPSGPPAQ